MKKNTRKLAGVIIFAVLLIFTMVGCGTEKLDNTVKVQGESDDWMNDLNSSDSARRHYKIEGEEEKDSKEKESKEKKDEQKNSQNKTGESTDEEDEEYFDAESAGEDTVDYSKYEDKKNSGNNSGSESGDGNEETAGGVTYSDGSATNQGEYETDPIPDGQQNPVEPGEIPVDTSKENTCYLSITCETILDNMENLTEGKESLVPSDGVIYGRREVTFYEGETVSDVLKRETQNNRIHMEYSFTPVYNSDYIEGINNLYEYDCGRGSGWMYCVNGWYPNYGCSRYIVQPGDEIEWHYTCDFGRDLGVDWMR